MTYKITYSTSIYGNFIIYYLGCLKSIYCLPYRHFVIHTTKESKELFYKIANQYSINLDNVDFIVHKSPKSIWDCSWWRYETLQMNYDIVHVIDSDTVCCGIDKYYDSWYLDYPNLDFFMMHIHKRHYDFMAGLCSFNISNIKWSYSGGEYRVEFMQEYSSGNVEDKGTKILTLSGCPSFFKIKSEIWRGI